MAVTFLWDDDYEASPISSAVAVSLLDNEVRNLARGIREREEFGHNWGPYRNSDDGSHVRGEVEVMGSGTAVAMAALVDVREGALFDVTDDAKHVIYCYYDAAWNAIAGSKHSDMVGLTDHDHPQYLLASGGTMTVDLNLGGQVLKTAEAAAATFGGMLLYRHKTKTHSTIGNVDAIEDSAVTGAKVTFTTFEASGSILTGSSAMISMPANFVFYPQIYIRGATSTLDIADETVWMSRWFNNRVQIANGSGQTIDYRIRAEYLT